MDYWGYKGFNSFESQKEIVFVLPGGFGFQKFVFGFELVPVKYSFTFDPVLKHGFIFVEFIGLINFKSLIADCIDINKGLIKHGYCRIYRIFGKLYE